LDNQVKDGVYFNFRYPLNDSFFPVSLVRGLNLSLTEEYIKKYLKIKTKSEMEKERQDEEDERLRI